MSKIANKSAQAFYNYRNSAIDNTIVNLEGMFLSGNHIAKRVKHGGVVAINFCGYPTKATAARLNALLSLLSDGKIKVGIKKGEPFLRYRDGIVVPLPSKGWVNIATL